MSRQCDAIACSSDVAPGKFMCIQHWRMVPTDVQRTITQRYKAGRRDFAFLSDQYYLNACIAAIDQIASKEGKPTADTSYHRLLRVAMRRAETKAA